MTYAEFGDLLQAGSPLTLAGAAFLGLITSLGPCTFLRGATLFALVGERPTRRQGLAVAGAFVAGLAAIYSLLGLVTGLLSEFIPVSNIVYPFAGAMLIVLALNTAGLIKLKMPRGPEALYSLRSKLSESVTYGRSFVLGGSFGLMVCPCCLPALVLIFAFTFAEGIYAPGFLLIAVFTLFHSIPLLLMGYFAHMTRRLAGVRRHERLLNVGLAVILLATGLVVLWMA